MRPLPPPLSLWEANFVLTHYLSYQIFCLNTGGLSVPPGVEAFETQMRIPHFSYLLALSGACLAGPALRSEALSTEGPLPPGLHGKRAEGEGGCTGPSQHSNLHFKNITPSYPQNGGVGCEAMRTRLGRKTWMTQTPERVSSHAKQGHWGSPGTVRRQEEQRGSPGQGLCRAFHGEANGAEQTA